MEFKSQNFTCPITRELLKEPISLPCCGNMVSRIPMIEWFEQSKTCPLCRKDISTFNPSTAPKIVSVANEIEEIIKKNTVPEISEPIKQVNPWKITVEKVPKLNPVYKTQIGKLKIINTDKKNEFMTLLIPVIDVSGSMSGEPIRQAIYSLLRTVDLTYNSQNIMTNIVSYSDVGKIIEINKSSPKTFYEGQVNLFRASGGTSFTEAFKKILEIANKNKDNEFVASIVVIFLTDGEDSSVKIDDRKQLVDKFRIELNNIWKKTYTIHTVGFGANHDYQFLNNLRQIGKEGAYRFADPNEDTDSLSRKINSILNVIATECSVSIKINSSTLKIINGENDKYWINLTDTNLNEHHELVLEVNNRQYTTEVTFSDTENEQILKTEWISYLVDEIASELLQLSKSSSSKQENVPSGKQEVTTTNNLDQQLHLELLVQRSKAIIIHIDETNPDHKRLGQLMESINLLKSGNKINEQKLNDMKFEGKYASGVSNNTPVPQQKVIIEADHKYNKLNAYLNKGTWTIISTKPNVFNEDDYKIVTSCSNQKALEWINTNNNNVSFIAACSVGRCTLVKHFLVNNNLNINHVINKFTALDLAIFGGYWFTTEMLFKNNAKINQDPQLLLRTCISKGYFNTAMLLLKNKVATITDDMLDSVPTNEGLIWLNKQAQKNVSIDKAILNGLISEVESQLDTIKFISWKPFMQIFINSTYEHIQIVDLLLKHKKADPNECFELDSETLGELLLSSKHPTNMVELEVTWPLFVTCEKGQFKMFELLLTYIDKKLINMQNKKGTTCLWIASCNRHIDIVDRLLTNSADPNITNFKGDGPLIPSCQKGNKSIVELLLDSGASVHKFNKNRDNAVLICCRTGQSEILDMILNRLSPEERKQVLEISAEIDGFDPLHASTELDKIECITTCIKHGANIEAITAENNQIIAGATSLHLACYYGRVNAVKTLINLNANVTLKTTVNGYTPLHIAIKQGHINVVRYLMSLEKCRQCLEIKDFEGRLPIYYANMNSNKEILDEFFNNKLSGYLNTMLYTDSETSKKCMDVIINRSRSLGCYEYDKVCDTDIDRGMTLITQAIMTNNKFLTDNLINISDLTKADDYGITPEFWMALQGFTKTDNNKINTMITNVQTVAKKSLQNKLLTNLQKDLPALTDYKQIDPIMKMSFGSAMKVHSDVVNMIKKSSSDNHSLLGFMDKVKGNKMFTKPCDAKSIEYILWDSKIHLIKLIATQEEILEPIHLLALYLYTSNFDIFQQTNLSLSTWNKSTQWHSFVGCLYQAINMLPKFLGEVYRAIDTSFDPEFYKVGTLIKWSTFSIASREYTSSAELIKSKKGIVFIINSKTGRFISKYTKFPVDAEVIFPPESQFKVTALYKANIIALGQANIRPQTFAIKDTDIQKAAEGKSSIIIELDELV